MDSKIVLSPAYLFKKNTTKNITFAEHRIVKKNKSYDFIVGNPRSGTTLLSMILNSIEDAFVLLESETTKRVIADFKQPYPELRKTKKYLEILLSSNKEIPIKIENNQLNTVLKSKNDSVKKQCISIAECLKIFEKTGKNKNFYIEKNPGFSFLVKDLIKHFPEAKFIWMTRDYRAFANSRMENRNHSKNSVNTDLSGYIWNTYIEELKQCEQLFGERILHIRYEDLVTNQKETIAKICKFIGVIYTDDLCNIAQLELNKKITATTTRTSTKFNDLSKHIYTDRINSWQHNLSQEQIKRLDTICGKNGIYKGQNEIAPLFNLWIKTTRLPFWLNSKYFVRKSKKS